MPTSDPGGFTDAFPSQSRHRITSYNVCYTKLLRYIPLRHNQEYIERAISRIKAAGPVAVFSTVVGESSVRFYQAYDRAGFDRTKQPIASLTSGEPELLAVGKDASIRNNFV